MHRPAVISPFLSKNPSNFNSVFYSDNYALSTPQNFSDFPKTQEYFSPASTTPSISELKVIHLRGTSQIQSVQHLRKELYLSSKNLNTQSFQEREQCRDNLGYVFAFLLEDKLVGTLRAVPMIHKITPSEDLIKRLKLEEHIPEKGCWEIGRLVLSPEVRSGGILLKPCLYLTLKYLIENTNIENLFASCTHLLSRLYRRFGFSVLAKDIAIEGAKEDYSLVYGEAGSVLRYLSPETSKVQINRVTH